MSGESRLICLTINNSIQSKVFVALFVQTPLISFDPSSFYPKLKLQNFPSMHWNVFKIPPNIPKILKFFIDPIILSENAQELRPRFYPRVYCTSLFQALLIFFFSYCCLQGRFQERNWFNCTITFCRVLVGWHLFKNCQFSNLRKMCPSTRIKLHPLNHHH